MIEVNGHNCTDCAHEAVCCHKASFIDIRREFLEVANNMGKQQINDYDIVSEIAVKCRHYYTKAITRGNISPITSPYYNNFTSVTSSTSSNTSNSTDLLKSLNCQTPGYYADKED